MNATNQKLLSILSTFTPDDWKNFGLFIKSPYFVTGRNYNILFDHFYKNYKSIKTIDEISFDKIIYNVFTKKKMSEQTTRNRLTEFTVLTEKFIKQKYFSEDILSEKYYLLKFYSDNSLYKQFDVEYDVEGDKFNPAEISTKDFEKVISILPLKFEKDFKINEFENGISVFHKYSLYQTANLLREFFYTGIQYTKLDTENIRYEFNPLKDILPSLNLVELIKKIEKFNSPIFNTALVYYYLYEIIVNDKGDEFLDKLEILFLGKEDRYEEDIRIEVINDLEYYYVQKFNKGETKHVKALFNIIKRKLINGKFSEVVRLHKEIFFDNYVIVGLKAGDYSNVKEFIKENLNSLPEEMREYFSTLENARLLVYKNKFKEALNLIENRKEKTIFNYAIIVLKLRVQYELSMTEEALLEVDRIKHFLRRTKSLTENQKKLTSLFISYFIKLLKVKDNPDHKNLEELLVNLNKSKVRIPGIDWLRVKVKELEKEC